MIMFVSVYGLLLSSSGQKNNSCTIKTVLTSDIFMTRAVNVV